MTHSDVNTQRENHGSEMAILHTIDVTSLDGANYENYNPTSEVDVHRFSSVEVVGLENPSTYIVQWDTSNDRLAVEQYGGTDPTSSTNVGEVQLRVYGE